MRLPVTLSCALSLIALLGSASRPALAGPADLPFICSELALATEVELESVRSDFAHNTRYTTEVPATEIKDQCQSRSCWIYSGTSNLEQRVLNHTGKKIDLSEQFLIVQAMRLRAIDALEHPGTQYAPGGSAGNVDWLVETFGIVPDAVWHPRIDFQRAPIAQRLYYFINARLAKYHLEMTDAMTEAGKKALYDNAKTDILELIESYSGKLPTSFHFDGAEYTSPQDFATRMIPSDPRPTIQYVPPKVKLPEEIRNVLDGAGEHGPTAHLTPSYETQRLSPEAIGEKIKAALARGESVRLGYESVHEFIDDKTGIMSMAAFYLPKDFAPPPKAYRSAYDFKGMGHAVEVVGVDVAPDGHIIKLKIKNSHGEAIGDHGFLHMYWDYFKTFMTSVYIREGAP